MILSDREIRAALVRGLIRITPDPREQSDIWSSTALDLCLHQTLAYWNFPPGIDTPVSPADVNYDFNATLQNFSRTIQIPAEGHTVRPGDFCLGWTVERLQLPYRSRIAARVEGKSSLARLGLGVHVRRQRSMQVLGTSRIRPIIQAARFNLRSGISGRFASC